MLSVALPTQVGLACRLLESKLFGRFIVFVIIVNALVLGLETSASLMASPLGPVLVGIDRACLAFFVFEISLALFVYRLSFFRDPWRIFDLAVVAVALVPAQGGLAVLRSLRVLRVLRAITVVPSLKAVVNAFLGALPGMGSIAALLLILFYVAAVMATSLFGKEFSDWFGSIGASMYTLFQIMTLESWSMGIARPVIEKFPMAWIFFIGFIALSTFTTLNLFIAVIVNAMQNEAILGQTSKDQKEPSASAASAAADESALKTEPLPDARAHSELASELALLRNDIAQLRASVDSFVKVR